MENDYPTAYSDFVLKMRPHYAEIMGRSFAFSEHIDTLESLCLELESYGFVREDKPFDGVLFQYMLSDFPFDYIVRVQDYMELEIFLCYRSVDGMKVVSNYRNSFSRIIRYFYSIEEMFYRLTFSLAETVLKNEDNDDAYILLNRKLTIK